MAWNYHPSSPNFYTWADGVEPALMEAEFNRWLLEPLPDTDIYINTTNDTPTASSEVNLVQQQVVCKREHAGDCHITKKIRTLATPTGKLTCFTFD